MSDESYNLTEEEDALINKYYHFYRSLEIGARVPTTEAQKHFVEVCKGHVAAITPHEIAYAKYMRIRARERRNKEQDPNYANGIPEYEEGYPRPGWFTDEDYKKMRSGEYADMKKRYRE